MGYILKLIDWFSQFFNRKNNHTQSNSMSGNHNYNNNSNIKSAPDNNGFIGNAQTVNINNNYPHPSTNNAPNTLLAAGVSPSIKIDAEPTFFARFNSPNSKCDGNWGLAFASIKIINLTPSPFTVKSLHLKYTIDNENYSVDSVVILTASIYSSLVKQKVNTAILTTELGNFNCMDWNNIRVQINDFSIIHPHGLLFGSAYFVLNIKEFEKLKHIKNVELILSDYSGLESVHPIPIENKKIDENKNYILNNRKDSCDALEKIHTQKDKPLEPS